ncbi:MAG: hypothetical protein B7733_02120 [Myxococcales bacterium FL481]|nr:MAG: hypothetical protein B7733_02120 [Myxococcales bacterium FL481]
MIDDEDLQLGYDLPGPALENPWTNFFADRSATPNTWSDEAITAWVRDDNYRDGNGQLTLAAKLRDALPTAWDENNNGRWDGYLPDAWFQFDDQGFDRAPDGTPTGWRAFRYYPLPGAFWPTNGSAGDVLIRLAPAFRHDRNGKEDLKIYRLNLAVVEALMKRQDVPIETTDERTIGVDLDKNGELGRAKVVRFEWAPTKGKMMHYVGEAEELRKAGKVHLAGGLLPEGTEFLHSVRYLDHRDGYVGMAPRMKELRHAKKRRWQTYSQLEQAAVQEAREKVAFPDRLRTIFGSLEVGVANGQGWQFQGFIEDEQGDLRPQTFEESVFCVGCHGGVGATVDASYSFERKLDAAADGTDWRHWSQIGFEGMPDRARADGTFEYARYLEEVGGGDDYRGNTEVQERFFDETGALRPEAVKQLRKEVASLIVPSGPRALALNRAYRQIVADQSYIRGRDTLVATPVTNIHQKLKSDTSTGVSDPVPATWEPLSKP